MDGEPCGSDESAVPPPAINLPAVLAGLDAEAERRDAVAAVREAVDEEPAACAPTIPKLRDLLGEGTAEEAAVAYCLAEIAEASPTDVAPSAGDIAAFVAGEHPSPAATEGFRALAAVADARPDAVEDHDDRLVRAIEAGPDPDRGSPRLWEAIERLERAIPSIATATPEDGRENGALGGSGYEGRPVAVVTEEPES
ncbi:hypothetical protein [Saliphagus sp. LR7]|uniref:hypothetical protein n=1 Tax=Saliphagus sp. LR7 TaxID=2282654 RepID=UPI000DF7A10D|nr:hypothetical protein [Saliphagus sp. LR7]